MTWAEVKVFCEGLGATLVFVDNDAYYFISS